MSDNIGDCCGACCEAGASAGAHQATKDCDTCGAVVCASLLLIVLVSFAFAKIFGKDEPPPPPRESVSHWLGRKTKDSAWDFLKGAVGK